MCRKEKASRTLDSEGRKEVSPDQIVSSPAQKTQLLFSTQSSLDWKRKLATCKAQLDRAHQAQPKGASRGKM